MNNRRHKRYKDRCQVLKIIITISRILILSVLISASMLFLLPHLGMELGIVADYDANILRNGLIFFATSILILGWHEFDPH